MRIYIVYTYNAHTHTHTRIRWCSIGIIYRRQSFDFAQRRSDGQLTFAISFASKFTGEYSRDACDIFNTSTGNYSLSLLETRASYTLYKAIKLKLCPLTTLTNLEQFPCYLLLVYVYVVNILYVVTLSHTITSCVYLWVSFGRWLDEKCAPNYYCVVRRLKSVLILSYAIPKRKLRVLTWKKKELSCVRLQNSRKHVLQAKLEILINKSNVCLITYGLLRRNVIFPSYNIVYSEKKMLDMKGCWPFQVRHRNWNIYKYIAQAAVVRVSSHSIGCLRAATV